MRELGVLVSLWEQRGDEDVADISHGGWSRRFFLPYHVVI